MPVREFSEMLLSPWSPLCLEKMPLDSSDANSFWAQLGSAELAQTSERGVPPPWGQEPVGMGTPALGVPPPVAAGEDGAMNRSCPSHSRLVLSSPLPVDFLSKNS